MSAIDRIIGYREVRDDLTDLLYMTEHTDLFREAGLSAPRGLLITGVKGLGKYFMAEQFMEDSTRIGFCIDSPDLSKEVLDAMANFVNGMQPDGRYLIFIKDFDGFFEDRNNRLPALLRAFSHSINQYDVFILGTAADVSKIPMEFLGPDFLEERIHINYPGPEDAKLMISRLLEDLHVTSDVSIDDIYGMMANSSYAELKQFLSSAALSMKLHQLKSVDRVSDEKRLSDTSFLHCLVECWAEQRYLPTDLYKSVDDHDILRTAYHEAGHVVVGELLQPGLIGYASVHPTAIRAQGGLTTPQNFVKTAKCQSMISFGGKAATKVMFEDQDDGAAGDLQKGLLSIKKQITELGYQGISLVTIRGDEPLSSDKYRESQEKAIYRLAEENFKETVDLLRRNKKFLTQVAEKLMRDRFILASEIRTIREKSTGQFQ